MRGGHWDYQNDHAANTIFEWMCPNYGDRGFEQSKIARRLNPLEDRLISELAWDIFCLLHSYDWYKSCDNSEETYREDVKFFKKKWFGGKGLPKAMIKGIVDDAVTELHEDLYKTFELEGNNCEA